MICRNCGKENLNTSKYCAYCGSTLINQSVINNGIGNSVNFNNTSMQQPSSLNYNQVVPQNNSLQQPIYGGTAPTSIQPQANNTVYPAPQPQSEPNLDIFGVQSTPVEPQPSTPVYPTPQPSIQANDIVYQTQPQVSTQSEIQNVVGSPATMAQPVEPVSTQNTIQTSTNNLLDTNGLPLSQSSIESYNVNNISNEEKTVEQPTSKSGGSKSLFIVAVFLILAAIVSFLIPVIMKNIKVNNVYTDHENVTLSLLDKGSFSGKVDILTDGNTINYNLTSKYSLENNVYKAHLTLKKEEETTDLYLNLLNSELNIYIPSKFVDMFENTNSEEDSWINYSISFNQSIDFNSIKLSEILDKEHFEYINEVNGISHYRITLDESNNSNEYLSNQSMEIYLNKSNEIVRITSELKDIGQKKASITFDIDFSSNNTQSIVIPQNILDSNITIDEYLNPSDLIENDDNQN